MTKRLFFVGILVSLSLMAFGKDFFVKGKVVNDKTNREIIGANIVFKQVKKPDRYIYKATTSKEGYSLVNIKMTSSKKGEPYKVKIEAEGYEDFSGSVTLIYNRKTRFFEVPTFKMNPLSKAASIEGKITSARTKKPILGVEVTVNGKTYKTDKEGAYNISVKNMYFFTPIEMNVSAIGFGFKKNEFKQSFELAPKEETKFALKVLPLDSDKVDIQFKGKVADLYGGANTEAVEISINDVVGKTGVDGSYNIKGLKIDFELEEKFTLKIKKAGYVSQDRELKVNFITGGVIPVSQVDLRHEDLESPKVTKPGKTAFSLHPTFEWNLPQKLLADIKSVKLVLSEDKKFKKSFEIVLEGALETTVFPGLAQKRLSPETKYYARVTYTLKRNQESVAGTLNFETASMQPSAPPIVSSPFTSGDSIDLNPSWAQDGKTVYFSSNLSDTSVKIFEIWSKKVNSAGKTKLTGSTFKSSDIGPSAGPGPKRVSYLSFQHGVYNIWSMPVGTNESGLPMQRTSFEDRSIRYISCDGSGQRIVYCREKKTKKGKKPKIEIWLLKTKDNSHSILGIQGTQVKISPDGSTILYVNDKQGSPDIWTVDINSGSKKQIVSNANVIDTDPSWVRDGGSIVFSTNKSGNFDLWVMNIRNGKKRPLTNSLADERYPDCNPVNNDVVYCTDETDIWKLKKLTIPEE
ncbi:MAG: hypothetical protein COA79_06615 [Planctomycetota bacterium]|nr:MAG: hypothetical protein COA79_06615 [Planctomycetota bacterium]